MSGIEIAGLVLAALPLVISALEHYEDIIGPTKAFFKFQGELDRAIRELTIQRTLFEQSIVLLLQPTTDDRQLNEMIDNTNSGLWKDLVIEDKLKANLGRAYEPYMRTVNDVQTTMMGIALKLDNIDGAENLNRDGLEAIISQHAAAKVNGKMQKFEVSRAIKFTMKKKNIERSLEKLQRSNALLDKFHDKADKIAAFSEPHRSNHRATFMLHVDPIRENAKRLYNGLSNKWCLTHSSHSAGLLLEQRLTRKLQRGRLGRNRRLPVLDNVNISCFSLSLLQSSTSALKKWVDVEVRVMEPDISGQPQSSVTQIRKPELPAISIMTPPSSTPYSNPSQLQIVTDLCSILQSPCHPCIGFCLDIDGHLRGTFDAQRSIVYIDEGVTLQEILMIPGALNGTQQYNLSITLVLSLLQLGHTPWLQGGWSKADIIFIRAEDQIGVDIKHPYLLREHTRTNLLIRQGASNDTSKVLSLGIMLLEIYSGRPIEEFLVQEDLGSNNQPNEISYLQAARRWVMEKEDKGEISHAFMGAILYCLQCYMDPGARLSDPAFLRSIEQRVLVPLDNEMDLILFGPT